MKLIKRVIRERHVRSVIEGTLHFSPCRTFVDLLELRYGYCWDHFGDSEKFDRCVANTFNDEHVQQRIRETVISCWSYNNESPYMWEVYGGSEAAIIVTAHEDQFVNYVKQKWDDDAAAGPVRYGFGTSLVRPEFIAPAHDSRWTKDFDLFFHKHQFYTFENEFRAVIFGQTEAVEMTLLDEMVKEITLSPCAPLSPSSLTALRKRFGSRIQNSRLSWSLAPPPKAVTLDDYMSDKQAFKTPEMINLFQELQQLKTNHHAEGWNDPKAPPIAEEQIQIGARISAIEKQLGRAIAEIRKSNEGEKESVPNEPEKQT